MYRGEINYLIHIMIEFNFLEWIVGIVTTFVLIYLFRASIMVNRITVMENRIKIPVTNKSCFFAATNVIVEVAIVENDQSFHFKLDRNVFILIPKKCCTCNNQKNERTFKTLDFEDNTIGLMNINLTYDSFLNNIPENTKLRIRIHANHEFTNFGKAFEFNFKFKEGKFVKTKQ